MWEYLSEKQLKSWIKRTLSAIVTLKGRKMVQDALKVVDRQERVDQEAKGLEDTLLNLLPDTPKSWKQNIVFEGLEERVGERIEGCQITTRDENKMWLVQYLENIRSDHLANFYPCLNSQLTMSLEKGAVKY